MAVTGVMEVRQQRLLKGIGGSGQQVEERYYSG